MKRFIFQAQTCAATNKSSNPWLRVFFCFFSSDQPKAVSLVKTLLKLYLQTKILNFKFNLKSKTFNLIYSGKSPARCVLVLSNVLASVFMFDPPENKRLSMMMDLVCVIVHYYEVASNKSEMTNLPGLTTVQLFRIF